MNLVSRKPLPRPDFIDFTLPDGSICLVSGASRTAASAVVRSLQQSELKCVVLSYPETVVPGGEPLAEGIDQVHLESLDEAHLEQALAAVRQQYGAIAIFVHLDPLPEEQGQLDEKDVVKSVFMLAKHLKEPLNQAAINGRAVFMTAVRLDGEFGLGGQAALEPVSGGLFGLVKSLNLEWSGVFCRALDINPALDAQQTADIILAEIHDPNRLVTEVGYNPKGRITLVVEPIHAVESH